MLQKLGTLKLRMFRTDDVCLRDAAFRLLRAWVANKWLCLFASGPYKPAFFGMPDVLLGDTRSVLLRVWASSYNMQRHRRRLLSDRKSAATALLIAIMTRG